MKPTLTLTDFIVNEDNDRYSVELVGTVNRKMIKMISRPVPLSSMDDASKSSIFYRTLSGLTLQAATTLSNAGYEFHYPTGMNITEQLSLFDIKQTPTFNNDLNKAGMESSSVLLAIW